MYLTVSILCFTIYRSPGYMNIIYCRDSILLCVSFFWVSSFLSLSHPVSCLHTNLCTKADRE